MFKEMRRKNQILSEEETVSILENRNCGVLALLDENGYPYAVPLSYVYCNNKIYFHGAKTGHKIDAIKISNKASFCVIDKNELLPEKYTTAFKSFIAFGKIRILEDDKEKMEAIKKLAVKFNPAGSEEMHMKEINSTWPALCLMEFTIEKMTGKQAIEILRGEV